MDEYEEEQNDIPPIGVSDEFRNAVLDAKSKLYHAIIFGPQLGKREAQSLTLINIYLKSLNELYKLSIDAKNGNSTNVDQFPVEIRESIKNALQVITDCFKKNVSVADRIPYENYLLNVFKKYQFVLKDEQL